MAKYKLIIIDDEFLVVRGLKETVDWKALDVEVVATASNGEEGLKQIRLHKPDLVISDIRMPVMGGLSLAQTLAEEKFDCALIIYSGYSDFDYVSTAMEYGVTRYLLKPIDSEVLIEKVGEVLQKLEQERENRKAVEQYHMGLPLLKANNLKKLLLGNDEAEAEADLKRIGITLPKSGIVIECAPLEITETSKEKLRAAYEELLKALGEFNSHGVEFEDSFCVITELADERALYDLVKDVTDRHSENGVKLVAGISAPYGHSITLQRAYERVKQLRSGYLFFAVNNVVSDGESPTVGKVDKMISDALCVIVEHYADKLTVKEVAEQLFVSESHLMHRFKDCLGKTFNDCLTEYRMQKARQALYEGEGDRRIKEVAAGVGYSDVRYFSQLFAKYFGESPRTFLDRRNGK